MGGSPYFPIPEGGLSCKLRVTVVPIKAAALGALCRLPAKAYYETAQPMRPTTTFNTSPERHAVGERRMTTVSPVWPGPMYAVLRKCHED